MHTVDNIVIYGVHMERYRRGAGEGRAVLFISEQPLGSSIQKNRRRVQINSPILTILHAESSLVVSI